MPVWQWLLESAGVLLLLPVLYGIALIVRRRVLSRHGGTFELSCRLHTAHPGRGWLLGLGRYSGEQPRVVPHLLALAPAAPRLVARLAVLLRSPRGAVGAEEMSLYAGHVIVSCTTPDGPVELAMSEASLTGFQSWLEAGPPGTDWDRHRT